MDITFVKQESFSPDPYLQGETLMEDKKIFHSLTYLLLLPPAWLTPPTLDQPTPTHL